jgi:predicted N-acetyltransferase YhbS
MDITLRLEEEKDYRIVEELTREAFWNLHVPGCDEHLLIHNLRKSKEFKQKLSYVAILDGKIVGNIVYVESKIIGLEKEHIVLTFGPVSVLPEYQNKGIGSKLIEYTKQLAKEMGYRAIIIYGYPEYYERFGFKASKEYKITNKDKKYPAALLVYELFSDALNGINGIFDEGDAYKVDKNLLEEFEKSFSKKEKIVTKSQEKFAQQIYL